jgi:hypothetical protein
MTLLNVHGVTKVKQIKIHAAKPLILQPISFEDEIAIEKLKRCKSLGTDQISVEIIQAGGTTLCSEIHRHILYGKEELPEQWKESLLCLFTRRTIKLIAVIIKEYHCYQLHTKFYLTLFCQH